MWKGAQDFTRVKEGMSKHTDWTVLTLTFDPKGWRTPWSMWRGGLHLWDRLRKRFIREWGKLRYVQTWESHRSGKPHVNIAISNENFYTACVMDWRLIRRQWVKPHARASGFGRIAHVTTAYDRDGLAGYFVKLARELTGTVHKDQIPYSAPPHFRRLRASQGLLPPAYKNDDISGRLHFYPPEIADLI